jgi:hypothetical protein
MLSEFEVAIWQIINEEIDLKSEENQYVLPILMMTALRAKEIAAEDENFKVFETFLWHNNPLFMERYTQWNLQIDYQESFDNFKINKMFKTLYSET